MAGPAAGGCGHVHSSLSEAAWRPPRTQLGPLPFAQAFAQAAWPPLGTAGVANCATEGGVARCHLDLRSQAAAARTLNAWHTSSCRTQRRPRCSGKEHSGSKLGQPPSTHSGRPTARTHPPTCARLHRPNGAEHVKAVDWRDAGGTARLSQPARGGGRAEFCLSSPSRWKHGSGLARRGRQACP